LICTFFIEFKIACNDCMVCSESSVSYINDVVCSLQKACLGELEHVMDCPRQVLIMNYQKMDH